jgi:hypothetical protein
LRWGRGGDREDYAIWGIGRRGGLHYNSEVESILNRPQQQEKL